MATLIPARSTCRFASPGERKFAERLEQKLEDDYLLWYDVAIGNAAFHPDFIVLHPRRGLAVVEVKDWNIESIHSIDKHRANLVTPRGLVSQIQPFEQARGYAHAMVNRLQRDPALIAGVETKYQGKLLFPWTYGVALTNITRRQFDDHQLGDVIPDNRVICKDEMTEAEIPWNFRSGFGRCFKSSFHTF